MTPVLVDSSVWIDHLRGVTAAHTSALRELIVAGGPGDMETLVADLVILEVLRGIEDQRQAERTRDALLSFRQVRLGGAALAVAAAEHFQALRRRGSTIRNGIDCMIAAWCIANDVALLQIDRDFAPFAAHCGLRLFELPGARGGGH